MSSLEMGTDTIDILDDIQASWENIDKNWPKARRRDPSRSFRTEYLRMVGSKNTSTIPSASPRKNQLVRSPSPVLPTLSVSKARRRTENRGFREWDLLLQNAVTATTTQSAWNGGNDEDLGRLPSTERIKVKQEEVERTDLPNIGLQHTDPVVGLSVQQFSHPSSSNNSATDDFKQAAANKITHHQAFMTIASSPTSNANDDLFHMGDLERNSAATKVVDLRAVRPSSEQIVTSPKISNINTDPVQQEPDIVDLSTTLAHVDEPQQILQTQEEVNPEDIESPVSTKHPTVLPEPILPAELSTNFEPQSEAVLPLDEESQKVGGEAANTENGNVSEAETILDEDGHVMKLDAPVITESSSLGQPTSSEVTALATAETSPQSPTLVVEMREATETPEKDDSTGNVVHDNPDEPLAKDAESVNVEPEYEPLVTDNPTENVMPTEVTSHDTVAASLDILIVPPEAVFIEGVTSQDLDKREAPTAVPASSLVADTNSTNSAEDRVGEVNSGDTISLDVQSEDTARPMLTLQSEIHPEEVPLDTIELVKRMPEIVPELIDSTDTFLPTPVEQAASKDIDANVSPPTISTEETERNATPQSVNEEDSTLAGSTSSENISLASPSSVTDNIGGSCMRSSTISQLSRSPSVPQTPLSIQSPILAQRILASPIPGVPWQARKRTQSQPPVVAPIPKIHLRLSEPAVIAPKHDSTFDPVSSQPDIKEHRSKTPSLKIILPPVQPSALFITLESPKDRSQATSPTLPLKIKLKYREPPSPESPPPFKRRKMTRSNTFLKKEPEPEIFDCIVVRTDFENAPEDVKVDLNEHIPTDAQTFGYWETIKKGRA